MVYLYIFIFDVIGSGEVKSATFTDDASSMPLSEYLDAGLAQHHVSPSLFHGDGPIVLSFSEDGGLRL